MDIRELEQQLVELKSRQQTLEESNKSLKSENESLKANEVLKRERENEKSLKSQAVLLCARYGLPSSVAEAIPRGATEAEITAFIENLSVAFKQAVSVETEASVQARFGEAGRTVDKSVGDGGFYTPEKIASMSPEAITADWTRVSESLKRMR